MSYQRLYRVKALEICYLELRLYFLIRHRQGLSVTGLVLTIPRLAKGAELAQVQDLPKFKKRQEMALSRADLDMLRSNISTDMRDHLKSELNPLVNQIATIDSAAQRLERSARANNLIIHGVTECGGSEDCFRLISLLEGLWKDLGP
jgi:hypothetical protein